MHQFVTRSSLKFLTGIILSQSTVSLSTSLLLTGPPNHVHVCVIFTVWFVSLGVSIVGLSGIQFNLYPFTNVTTTIRVRRKRMYIWKSISCEKISILNILKFRLYSPQWNLKTARIFIFNRMIEAIAPHLIVWLI